MKYKIDCTGIYCNGILLLSLPQLTRSETRGTTKLWTLVTFFISRCHRRKHGQTTNQSEISEADAIKPERVLYAIGYPMGFGEGGMGLLQDLRNTRLVSEEVWECIAR